MAAGRGVAAAGGALVVLKASGPPPTKVGQSPQVSVAVRGTVAPLLGLAWRTTNW